MVAKHSSPMDWLSSVSKGKHSFSFFCNEKSPSQTLGILSFETAKTMSRLIALYKSLSDDEFFNLRNGAMKSEGVAFLNSKDETFLLSLACQEKLQDLNGAACTVSRLGQKCSNFGLINQFDLILRHGIIDLTKLEFNSKNGGDKIIEKMEKYVTATSNLHSALECLAELEISERKLQLWKRNTKTNMDYFQDKISHQRKQVKHYRETSLWSQTFDKIVHIMIQIICIIYAKICVMFGPDVSNLPRISKNNVRPPSNQKHQHIRGQVHPELDHCLLEERDLYIKQRVFKSGPIPQTSKKTDKTRFYSRESFPDDIGFNFNIGAFYEFTNNKKQVQLQSASESTLGAAGLTLRYANIIILAEQYLHAPTCINDEARGVLYDMLPAKLKETVRGKLWRHWRKKEEEAVGGLDGHSLAEGWRDALEEMMTWLSPIAHDTVKWVMERNMEKQRFDAKPTVLLLQTLYYSDLEKTEAAIVEVLVGLSCIYRYENRRLGGGRRSR